MRILFYLGSLAQYHLFKYVISSLEKRGHHIQVVTTDDEILKGMLDDADCAYVEIKEHRTGENKLSNVISVIRRDRALFKIVKEFQPQVMLGTSVEITHVGKLLGAPSIIVCEDDFEVLSEFRRMAYLFGTSILAPSVCDVGRWTNKKISYEGYHELAYLHPNHFAPEENVVAELAPNGGEYFILRFAKVTSPRHGNSKGISPEMVQRLIDCLEPYGRVYISSEQMLEGEFEAYRLTIDPRMVHSALYYASMFIGDSQAMAAEAAVLGTPSIHFDDHVGEVSYLEELEHRFGLTYGVSSGKPDRLLRKIKVWLRRPDLQQEWLRRQRYMLNHKVDVAQFMCSLIERYGHSPSTQLVAADASYLPQSHL